MKEYFEIKVWHIVAVLFCLFTLYVFTTGYECGFLGGCNYPASNMWQGFARFFIIIVLSITILVFTMSAILDNEGFKIKNPFYDEGDAEAWNEYQQWLKERKK